MNKAMFALGLAAAGLAVTGCGGNGGGNQAGAQTPAAEEAAGGKTIAAGLQQNGRFMAIAKSAGLDQTLAGPGPYTVLAPSDAAFTASPQGSLDPTPENRAQITGVITNLILPGTVLSADIGKAIEAGKGKAVLATMGGGTLTATRDGGKIVLANASGQRATVTQADQRFSNGVVHQIDAVLTPAQGGAGAAEPAANATGQ